MRPARTWLRCCTVWVSRYSPGSSARGSSPTSASFGARRLRRSRLKRDLQKGHVFSTSAHRVMHGKQNLRVEGGEAPVARAARRRDRRAGCEVQQLQLGGSRGLTGGSTSRARQSRPAPLPGRCRSPPWCRPPLGAGEAAGRNRHSAAAVVEVPARCGPRPCTTTKSCRPLGARAAAAKATRGRGERGAVFDRAACACRADV